MSSETKSLYTETEVEQLMTEVQPLVVAPVKRVWSEIQDGGKFLLICADFFDDASSFAIKRTTERVSEFMRNRFGEETGRMTWMIVATVGSTVVDSATG